MPRFVPALLTLLLASPAVAKIYVINEITITDPAKYAEYVKQSPSPVEEFGGRYLVRGGSSEGWGGTPPAQRTVIVEFPSRAQAQSWHDSPAYRRAKAMRDAASTSRVYIVEGITP